MKRFSLSVLFVSLALQGYAQQAGLTAESSRLSSYGGTVKIAASVTYEQAPGALGWSITLPIGWSLVETSGAQTPEIAPSAGAVSKLEWAFVSIPNSSAQFEFTVSYPAGLRQTQRISADVVTCSDGTTKSILASGLTFSPERNRPGVREK